jgi:dephospho-CoA kinase
MLTIGLTGGMGSGKSTVARILRVLEVPVFEADAAGRAALDDDPGLRAAVAGRFGHHLYASGKLDRKALADIVFQDPGALATLNGLVHPVVRETFRAWVAVQHAAYVVMESAILVETGGHGAFDRLVVVSAGEEVRMRRVMRRDGVSGEAVKARMRNQATEEERLARADHVLVNEEDRLLVPQVLALHQTLVHLATP